MIFLKKVFIAKINHKNLRSLKKSSSALSSIWHHSCTQRSNTARAVQGSQQEMLTAVLSSVYLLLLSGSHEDMQLSLQDKGERDFLTNTAVFSTSIPPCLRHSLSAITHRRAQSFPVALAWNNTMKKALLHERYSAITLLCRTAIPRAGHHPLWAVMARIHPSSL